MTDLSSDALLYRFSRQLHQLNFAPLMDTIVHETGEAMRTPLVCLAVYTPDGQMDTAAALNLETTGDWWETLLQSDLPHRPRQSGKVTVYPDLNSQVAAALRALPGAPTAGSAVFVPLMRDRDVHAEAFGVLILMHPVPGYFDAARLELLYAMGDLAAAALQNALIYRDVHHEARFTSAAVPMLLTDLDGYVLAVNDEALRLFGYDPDLLIGAPVDLIHRRAVEALHVSSLRAMAPESEISFRTLARHASGTELPVIVRARRRDLNGQDVVELIEYDLSAHTEAEQLQHDLTAMVYHDLRGPLQNINTSVQRMVRFLANHENPAVLTMLQGATRSVRQLRRMIDSLLDLQRLEAGHAILNRQVTEMRVLMADAVQLVMPLAMEAGQRVKFDVAPEIPLLMLDNDMILRVVINLLENAIKYTPDNGVIHLKAVLLEGAKTVKVIISDSGPGIPRHMQKQIFDKFARVNVQNAPKGVGLGLAFCRLAVEAHGGEIHVESDGSKGSDFIFTLPVVTEGVAAAATPATR